MALILSYGTLAGGLLLAAATLSFAAKLLRADKTESRKNASRVQSMRGALMGRARTRDDWLPDARVKGGLIYNRREKRLEICGKLSEDSFDRAFR